MAAPCMWNERNLIPPPTNFISSNPSECFKFPGQQFQAFKDALISICNGENLNGSLLQGEQITLSRLLYKHKNAQRSWKVYQILVKIQKCLERLAETKVHSYTGSILSHYDSSQSSSDNGSADGLSLPSSQMLDYLLVSLQGCAKLCVHIATMCEQSATIMMGTIQSGMFISNSLALLSIVSRIRLLICRYLKAAVAWYDSLLQLKPQLPSAKTEWLTEGTELPRSLMEWLGDDAKQLTNRLIRKSAATPKRRFNLDKIFSSLPDASVDIDLSISSAIGVIVSEPDLGEKLSEADLTALKRSKMPQNNLLSLSTTKTNSSRRNKRKMNSQQFRAKKHKVGHWQLLNNSSNPVRHKVRALAGSAFASVGRRQGNVRQRRSSSSGKRRTSCSSDRRNGIPVFRRSLSKERKSISVFRRSLSKERSGIPALRRSLSKESLMGSHSVTDSGRRTRLHQCLNKAKGKRRTTQPISQSSNFNCLVIPNEAMSVSPGRMHRSQKFTPRKHERRQSTKRGEPESLSFSSKRKRLKISGRPEQQVSRGTFESLPYQSTVHQLSNPFTSSQVGSSNQGESVSQEVPKTSRKGKMLKRLRKIKQTLSSKFKAGKKDRNMIPDSTLVYSNFAAGNHSGLEQLGPYRTQHHVPHRQIQMSNSQSHNGSRYAQRREQDLWQQQQQSQHFPQQQWQVPQQSQRSWSPSGSQPYQHHHNHQQEQHQNHHQSQVLKQNLLNQQNFPRHVRHQGKYASGQFVKRNVPHPQTSKNVPRDNQHPNTDEDIDSIFANLL